MGAGADVRATARAEPRRSALELLRRADHSQQPDGRPPRVGPHAQGRLPALQGAARLRPALPERLRLPGPLGRGRGREGWASTPSARSRSTASPSSPRAAASAWPSYARCSPSSPSVSASGWTGTTATTPSATRTSSTSGASCRTCHRRGWLYKGHRSTRVVPPLRHVDLPARARRGRVYNELEHPSLFVRFPLQGARRRGARGLDDDAVDAAGQRGRGGDARRGVRSADDRRLGRVPRAARRDLGGSRARVESSSGSSTRGRSTSCRRRRASCTASSPGTTSSLDEGTGIVHIAPGCRRRGLRALTRCTTCPCSPRSTRPASSRRVRRLRRG